MMQGTRGVINAANHIIYVCVKVYNFNGHKYINKRVNSVGMYMYISHYYIPIFGDIYHCNIQ